MNFWLVIRKDMTESRVICNALNRENAKAKSFNFLGGNPEDYQVEPLSAIGTRVFFDITVDS